MMPNMKKNLTFNAPNNGRTPIASIDTIFFNLFPQPQIARMRYKSDKIESIRTHEKISIGGTATMLRSRCVVRYRFFSKCRVVTWMLGSLSCEILNSRFSCRPPWTQRWNGKFTSQYSISSFFLSPRQSTLKCKVMLLNKFFSTAILLSHIKLGTFVLIPRKNSKLKIKKNKVSIQIGYTSDETSKR